MAAFTVAELENMVIVNMGGLQDCQGRKETDDKRADLGLVRHA